MTDQLKIIINAQLLSGKSGGIEQFLMGLIHGLGKLEDGSEEYIIIGPWQDPYWLKPLLGPNQVIVAAKQPAKQPMIWQAQRKIVKACAGPLYEPLASLWRKIHVMAFPNLNENQPGTTKVGRFLESFGGHLIHFPYQQFVHCRLPSIYNPHDLQHLHYPQFFSHQELANRRACYAEACLKSQAIAAESQWVKNDIIRQYGIDSSKVYVISRGSPTELCEEPVEVKTLMRVRQKFSLPKEFAFYPAQTWKHKNHIRLLEAIRLLRDKQGISLNLICTGKKNDFWLTIEKRINELGLNKQVCFLGYVDSSEVRAIYRLAQFVVLPTLFEGGGFPIVEAFNEGVPVACSDVTSLPEYGSDAVLLFDPTSVENIAKAIYRMTLDSELRESLRRRGVARARLFTWEKTAKTYRALYRLLAGRSLSAEDQCLLSTSQPTASVPPLAEEGTGNINGKG
jgi:glycosyltransferase involved in cell wall biosynthesis